MKSLAKQQGLGALGIGIFVLMIVFCLTIVVKLLPGYIEHWNVKSSLESLTNDTELRSSRPNKKKILTFLWRRLEVNDVESVDIKKHVKFKNAPEEGGYLIQVKYSYRTHLFYNVDALINFDDQVVMKVKSS